MAIFMLQHFAITFALSLPSARVLIKGPAITRVQLRRSKLPARPPQWSSDIETGLPDIDRQHRHLFEIAATFHGEGDQIRVMKTLAMLVDYANTHLRDEEAMLTAIGYAGLDAHREKHREFRAMLRQLVVESRRMTLDQIAARIDELINGWFYEHILTVDAEYVAEVNAFRIARTEKRRA